MFYKRKLAFFEALHTWHIDFGARCFCEELNSASCFLCINHKDSLHAEGDKTADTAASSSMVLEILEDCYVARILRQEGETVAVGEPIALLCEELETLKTLQDASFELPP